MTGDQADMLGRLKSLLPDGWFEGPTPVLDALLSGPAWALSATYDLITYARLQTRLRTATGGWLDRAALDFFGRELVRSPNQSDASFRAKLLAVLVRERDTRRAISSVLSDLTGRAPQIVETWNTGDTGGWDTPALAYDAAGAWGDANIVYQTFVTAFRPLHVGVSSIAGWDVPTGALDTASQLEWAPIEAADAITDADIMAAIESVRMAGTVIWVNILS